MKIQLVFEFPVANPCEMLRFLQFILRLLFCYLRVLQIRINHTQNYKLRPYSYTNHFAKRVVLY